MNSFGYQLPAGNSITTQFIRHDLPGLASMCPQNRFGAAPFLRACRKPSTTSLCPKHFVGQALLGNCPPQILLLAIDLDENLVDAEGIAIAFMLPFQAPGMFGTKRDTPASDSLVANDDASLSQDIFNIAVAQVEAIVEPNPLTDDISRESVIFVSIHGAILTISDCYIVSTIEK